MANESQREGCFCSNLHDACSHPYIYEYIYIYIYIYIYVCYVARPIVTLPTSHAISGVGLDRESSHPMRRRRFVISTFHNQG
jgi:hypothetical protein